MKSYSPGQNDYTMPRFRVSLIRENTATAPDCAISASPDAARIMAPYFAGLDREHFIVIGLDSKNHIIGLNTVAIGSLSMAIVHPREVFKPLILMNAAGFICAHNHPSGDCTPSIEDRTLTARLRQGAELIGIAHRRVGGDRHAAIRLSDRLPIQTTLQDQARRASWEKPNSRNTIM